MRNSFADVVAVKRAKLTTYTSQCYCTGTDNNSVLYCSPGLWSMNGKGKKKYRFSVLPSLFAVVGRGSSRVRGWGCRCRRCWPLFGNNKLTLMPLFYWLISRNHTGRHFLLADQPKLNADRQTDSRRSFPFSSCFLESPAIPQTPTPVLPARFPTEWLSSKRRGSSKKEEIFSVAV